MKKLIPAVAMALFAFSSYSFAQNPVIEKAIKDPQRKEKEAKADKVVADSTRKTVQMTIPGSSQKKKCCTKSCCSNSKKKSS